DTICLKCLEKEPSGRYHDVGALAEDLRRFLAGEPIQAHPVGRLARLARWCRRRPTLAAASALAASALVAVVTLALLFADHQRRAARSLWAEQARTKEALARAEAHYALAERRSATLTLQRGLALCRLGGARVRLGLLWMARSLEILS